MARKIAALMMVLMMWSVSGLTAALVGCSGPNRPAWASFDPEDWANRSQSDEPIELEVAGPVAVDVENFNGDVVIEAKSDLEKARVTVQRTAIHGYERRKEAKSSLDDIRYTVDIVPGQLGQTLQVIATSSNDEPHFQRANIFIELPSVDGVNVRTTNGKVYAIGIQGVVDIATTHGGVRVMTNLPMHRPVTVVNKGGSIDYRVRGESTGAFDAHTINGRVTNRVRYGSFIVRQPTGADRLTAILNDGENPIVLRTVNADIRVAVVHNPEQVGDYIMN